MNMNIAAAQAHALGAIERTERWYRMAFLGGCALECVVLGALLLAADLSNRTHVILLTGFVGSYSIVVLAIAALGAHVTRVNLRVLQAIDVASRQS